MIAKEEAESRLVGFGRAPHESRAALLARQRAFFEQVVRHAGARVPHYQRAFSERGLVAERIRLEDLAALPILGREELQALGSSELLVPGAPIHALAPMRSSGSTGRPIVAYQTPIERILYVQLRRRTFQLLGPEYGGRITYVGIDTRSPEEKARQIGQPLTVIEARREIEPIFEELARSRPNVLVSYPGVLAELVRRVPQGELRALGLRLVVASGEVLTSEIETSTSEAFGCRVTATYASSEFFWMGGRCSVTGEYHVVDDSLLLEVVDEAGRPVRPGEEGDVVATALHSFVQPLIRYRIGDRAVQGRSPSLGALGCSCGAPFSTIEGVLGRSLDYLALPDGRRVHAYVLSLSIRDHAPFVEQFRVVQHARDHIELRLLARPAPAAEELSALVSRIAPLVAPARLGVSLVTDLPRSANGKFRVVESRLDELSRSPEAGHAASLGGASASDDSERFDGE